MAKVALRNYVRELEGLIENGQHDEVIAHCRHILKFHPKHLEIYRLLGKAYLETKRYAEAEDIFNRILVAVPDDFVSHAGMSIVKDEKGNLDEALWHMERAFETQPSNTAIQGELQRLYGRRDGVEPPRIRMTRGALAHMYIQGELYPQAISEIRAILAQDPQRADMQILLAEAFFHSGQKADASEVCSRLLTSLPYCFEANRIMVELLHGKDKIDKAQEYRQRVCELDPYAMYAPDSVFRSAEVPDHTIQVERLVTGVREVPVMKSASAVEAQPDWLSKGIGDIKDEPGSPKEAPKPSDSGRSVIPPAAGTKIPSHMDIPSKEANPVQPMSSSTPDNIPEFLREAGWKESSGGTGDESGSLLFESGSTGALENRAIESADDELMPVELPDWLKSKAPGEAQGKPSATEPLPDWLDQLTSTAGKDERNGGKPSDATSAWLRGLNEHGSEPDISQPFHADEREISSPFSVTPDEVSEPSTGTSKADSETEQKQAMGWLETLASDQGAKNDELVANPFENMEKPPNWISEVMDEVKDRPSELKEPEIPAASEDETGVWLRDLDKAKPLTSKPEEGVPEPAAGTKESTPGWLDELDQKFISEGSVDSAEGDLPGWLQNLNPAVSETRTDNLENKKPGTAQAEDLLKDTNEKEARPFSIAADLGTNATSSSKFIDQPSEIPADTGTAQQGEPDMPTWLKGLDQKAPGSEDQEDNFTRPDWLKSVESKPGETPFGDNEKASQLPDMPALKDLQSEKTPIDDGVIEEQDLSDWLQSLDDVPPGIPATTSIDTMPRWMRGETEAPPKTEPTAPGDWRPIEEAGASKPEVTSATGASEENQPVEVQPIQEKNPIKSDGKNHELVQAQGSLNSGDLSGALDQYNHFIKSGTLLDETIHDLRQAVYRYPIEVGLWQALGDAYMRANRLQEALDAFNKAEELLR